MLWTPISALAAGVAIVGTAGSVIAVKQGLAPQSVRVPRTEQANLLTKDVARLPAGLPDLPVEAPAKTLVDEMTVFAFPPSSGAEEADEVQRGEEKTEEKIETAVAVPLPAPRVEPPARRVTPPRFRPRVAQAAPPRAHAPRQYARVQPAAKPAPAARATPAKPAQTAAQGESWLSRLRASLTQAATPQPARTTTVARR